MPLRIFVELGERTDVTPEELMEVLRDFYRERAEVERPGRFMVPDVMVKTRDGGDAMVKIKRSRRKGLRLRVEAYAPSGSPLGFAIKQADTQPLVKEVAQVLEQSEKLRRA